MVAGMLLLLMVAGGGTVGLREGDTTAEGLVVATAGDGFTCEPATNTFGGVGLGGYFYGRDGPFQTCYLYEKKKWRDQILLVQFLLPYNKREFYTCLDQMVRMSPEAD